MGLFFEDDFSGSGNLDGKTVSYGGVDYVWLGIEASYVLRDPLTLSGGAASSVGSSRGYMLTYAATGEPVRVSGAVRIECSFVAVEAGYTTIALGTATSGTSYNIQNGFQYGGATGGGYMRIGYSGQLSSDTSFAGTFSPNTLRVPGAYSMALDMSDLRITTYSLDGVALGTFNYYTPGLSPGIFISDRENQLTYIAVYADTEPTPPEPAYPPLIYKEAFDGVLPLYDTPLEKSCIGDDTATWVPAPSPMLGTDIFNRTSPSTGGGAAFFDAPAAGSGDRFYVSFNELGRPVTAEWVEATALVSLANDGDTVRFGFLDANNQKRIAAGVRLSIETGYLAVYSLRYIGGVHYEDRVTLAGEDTLITGFRPGDYWLRCARSPYTSPYSELTLDMTARGGVVWLGGLGGLTVDTYIAEPVVELTGTARLHHIYVGTDEPPLTAIAILDDGTFWTRLVNAEEKV